MTRDLTLRTMVKQRKFEKEIIISLVKSIWNLGTYQGHVLLYSLMTNAIGVTQVH